MFIYLNYFSGERCGPWASCFLILILVKKKSLENFRFVYIESIFVLIFVCLYLTEALFWVSVDSPAGPVHPLYQQRRCQRHVGMAENKRRAKWWGNNKTSFRVNCQSATCIWGEGANLICKSEIWHLNLIFNLNKI